MRKHLYYNEIDLIKKSVCSMLGITVEQLESKTRKREIVQARQICHMLSWMRYNLKISLADIGYQIGGKDHATVLHSKKTINNLIDTDKRFKMHFEEINSEIDVILKNYKIELEEKKNIELEEKKEIEKKELLELKLKEFDLNSSLIDLLKIKDIINIKIGIREIISNIQQNA